MTVDFPAKGFGTMSMTWTANPKPFEDSIERLNYVKEKYGVKLFNCGEFYQVDLKMANLELMRQFLQKYPDDSVIVSIKGGLNMSNLHPDGSKESIDKSIANSISYFKDLPVKPKIIFEIARVDPNVPYEHTISYIYEHVKNGDIDGVSLSEVGAESIKKAASVAPIYAIELEFSLLTQDILYNGILKEASKHQIPIMAYSPIGKGLLTDFCVESNDFLETLDPNDIRLHIADRFNKEIFVKNYPYLKKLYDFAKSKGMTLEGLALSYLESISGIEDFEGIPKVSTVMPIPSGSTNDKIDKNYGAMVKLSREDISSIQEICRSHKVHGHRYTEAHEASLNG